MKSICICNDSFPPYLDGVANAVVNYANILSEIGENPFVLTPDYPDVDDSIYKYKVIRMETFANNKLNKLGYTTANPYDLKAIKEVVSLKPDLLHCHCLTMSFFTAISIKKKIDVPLIFTYHTKYDVAIKDAVSGKALQEGMQKIMIGNIHKHCDEVWAVSDGAGKNLQSLGYEGEYVVMPNGVDLPKKRADDALVDEVTKEYNLPRNIPTFIFIGRLYWYKGIRIILDSLKKIKNKHKDFRMVFVGEGKDEKEIKQYAKDIGVFDKCIFVEAVQDREKIIAWNTRADLLLFPSTFDTNGLVVREACASQTPAMLIKNSCASEGIIDKYNGFLIDENAESMTKYLLNIMDNKELLKRVGECASNTLYLTWHDAIKRANERYDVVLENYKRKTL